MTWFPCERSAAAVLRLALREATVRPPEGRRREPSFFAGVDMLANDREGSDDLWIIAA